MKKNKKLAKVYHYDLYGKRDEKYKFLTEKSISSIEWNELDIREPEYDFKVVNHSINNSYRTNFPIGELFLVNASGIQTEFDDLSIHNSIDESNQMLSNLKSLSIDEIISIYKFDKSKSSKIKKAVSDLKENNAKIIKLNYKIFNSKFAIYTGKTNGIMGRPRYSSMRHLLYTNIGFVTMRTQVDSDSSSTYFVSKEPIDKNFYGFQTYVFPLYLYPEAGEQATLDQSGGEPKGRTPNLDIKLVSEIKKGIGLEFRDVTGDDIAGSVSRDESFAPLDILDYIYAVLHSPTYREKYKEFLKIDFPRVPYPKDKKKFWELVDLGSEIRLLHLLETADKYITSYPNDGSNIVERKMTKNSIGYEPTGDGVGRVWINDEQYFDGVPAVAWEFYIGGYQPAQKWLKDRVGRELNFEDINHYQKIIVALTETDRLMKEVDSVGVE